MTATANANAIAIATIHQHLPNVTNPLKDQHIRFRYIPSRTMIYEDPRTVRQVKTERQASICAKRTRTSPRSLNSLCAPLPVPSLKPTGWYTTTLLHGKMSHW